MSPKFQFLLLLLFVSFFYLTPGSFSVLEIMSIVLTIYFIIDFIDNFSKSIWTLIDSTIILALLTWLIVPLLFYHYFDSTNYYTILWDKAMRVDSWTYYSFILPGTVAMIAGIKWPFPQRRELALGIAEMRRQGLFNKPKFIGYSLIAIGLFFSFFDDFIPLQFAFVVYILQKLIFIGLFYLYFTGDRPKKWVLLIGLALLLASSIRQGMFGELVYMTALSVIILTLGYKISFLLKTILFALAISFIFLIQSVKGDYRKVAWNTGGNVEYFTELVINNVQNPSILLDEYRLFALSYRFNQGWLISATMDRIPKIAPFAEGETIFNSILATAIPRFLWPNKPESGGIANVERFLGWKNLGYSVNISPIGEAWGNFGYYGGILFMFFYGLFLRFSLNYIVKIIESTPTLIFWLPLLFLYVIRTESDILTGFNHLTKTGFFTFILFKIYPLLLRQRL